jgi:hypothetical protein
MIWSIIRKSVSDVWEEMLYLIIFNAIWFIGALLILPLPFVTFSLFATVYDVGEGKGIKLGTFFGHGRQVWKPAYIWGGINLVILLLLWINLSFYAGIDAQWAAIVRIVIVAMAIFWTILQLLALALYPRLVEPRFKLALRNAAAILGLQPLVVLSLVVILILLGIVVLLFPALTLGGAF